MSFYVFQPIGVWPEDWRDPNREREYSRFEATYTQTLSLLRRELNCLDVDECVIQVDARSSQIRRDGMMLANAKVEHPGVIVRFETERFGTLVYATDRFVGSYSRPAWQENLRAIALGLEALRKVERYGIAERGQQYAGYKELGSGIPLGAQQESSMSAEQAAKFMLDCAGMLKLTSISELLEDPEIADFAYKRAAKRSHPDVGGDTETFKRLNEARRVVAMAYRR